MPSNKGMKLTSPEHIGDSQLIPSVGPTVPERARRTLPRGPALLRSTCLLLAAQVLLVSCGANGNSSATLTSGAEGGGEPAIPRLSTWETNMTTYGAITCNNFVAQGVLFGTYYDGLFSMENIRAYRAAHGASASELATWDACSDTANAVYRDGYVLVNNGKVTGYNEFTHGMKVHRARTAEPESSKAVVYMAGFHLIDTIGQGAAYCSLDFNNPSIALQREIAYCMRSVLDWAAMGGEPQAAKRATMLANMKIQVAKRIGTRANPTPTILPHPEVAGGYCPPASPAGSNMYVAPFMLAIQAHSFMQYYEQVSPDADILETVRWIADFLRQEAYLPASKAFWYANCRVWGGATWGPKAAANDLSLMFVDIYQWLYLKTCDTSYRDFADGMFDEGVRLGPNFLGYDGKHFNQNYAQGSFDYVAMRQITSPSCP
jgi:hypothetical protein